MDNELKGGKRPLADIAIFWPTFAVFVVLLLVIYVATAPQAGGLVDLLLRH